ncbi:MAG: NTP transferase domain-containing protein [Acidimicrobiales bacterium]
MTERTLSAIVLAAGARARMKSSRPKPLHLLAGRTMLQYMLDGLVDCQVEQVVVVVGHGTGAGHQEAPAAEPDLHLTFVEQHQQLGTGDAASVGLTELPEDDGADSDDHDVLVLPGDHAAAAGGHHRRAGAAPPQADAMHGADGRADQAGSAASCRARTAAWSASSKRPARPTRAGDRRDPAPPCTASAARCWRRPSGGSTENAQGEYYLTDVVAVLRDAGYRVAAVEVDDPAEGDGINDRVQLRGRRGQITGAPTRRGCALGSPWSDPATYLDTTRGARRRRDLFPGRSCRAAPSWATAPRPEHLALVDCVVGPGGRRAVQRKRREIGAGATVGLRHPGPGASVPEGVVTGPFYASSPDDG